MICGGLLSICVSKHQLYAVFLIYRACARVVVDSGDVCLRVVLFDLSDHSARDDVVWQTAEGLRAHDVLYAVAHELDHLRRQQPALAHLHAVTDVAVGGGANLAKWARRAKSEALHLLNHHALEKFHYLSDRKRAVIRRAALAVELLVVDRIVDAGKYEVHQPRIYGLGIFAYEVGV